jgi:hypothetical protein
LSLSTLSGVVSKIEEHYHRNCRFNQEDDHQARRGSKRQWKDSVNREIVDDCGAEECFESSQKAIKSQQFETAISKYRMEMDGTQKILIFEKSTFQRYRRNRTLHGRPAELKQTGRTIFVFVIKRIEKIEKHSKKQGYQRSEGVTCDDSNISSRIEDIEGIFFGWIPMDSLCHHRSGEIFEGSGI